MYDFIVISLVIEFMSETLAKFDKQYKQLRDILEISYKESKNKIGTIILIFDIKVNINLFKASLLANKLNKNYHYNNCNSFFFHNSIKFWNKIKIN